MTRATRTAAIFAVGVLLGGTAGILIWEVTGFQALWSSVLLDLAGPLAVAAVMDWRQQWREAAKVIDGSQYTRSGAGPVEWVNTPGGSWTVEACGDPRCTQHPFTVRNSGLEIAPGAVSLRLSADAPGRRRRWRS